MKTCKSQSNFQRPALTDRINLPTQSFFEKPPSGIASCPLERCCGEFIPIKSSYHLLNCTNCGLCFVLNKSGTYVPAIREQSTKPFPLDHPMSTILRNMTRNSQQTMLDLSPCQDYLPKRQSIIDWLSGVGETLGLSNASIHHSILVMDIYFSKVMNLPYAEHKLVGIGCLLISAKFTELKYPSANNLNAMTNFSYNYQSIIAKECEILEALKWDLHRYTMLDFVNFYLAQGIIFPEDEVISYNKATGACQRNPTSETFVGYVRRYADFFADFCVQSQTFIHVDPHILACSVIAYARKQIKMAPVWNRELQILTGFKFEVFSKIFETIQVKYFQSFPEAAKDSIAQEIEEEQFKTRLSVSRNENGSGQTFKKQGLTIDIETPNKDELTFQSNLKSRDKSSTAKEAKLITSSNKKELQKRYATNCANQSGFERVKRELVKKSIMRTIDSPQKHTGSTSRNCTTNIGFASLKNIVTVAKQQKKSKPTITASLSTLMQHSKSHSNLGPANNVVRNASRNFIPNHQLQRKLNIGPYRHTPTGSVSSIKPFESENDTQRLRIMTKITDNNVTLQKILQNCSRNMSGAVTTRGNTTSIPVTQMIRDQLSKLPPQTATNQERSRRRQSVSKKENCPEQLKTRWKPVIPQAKVNIVIQNQKSMKSLQSMRR